jgi:hypothetical protein
MGIQWRTCKAELLFCEVHARTDSLALEDDRTCARLQATNSLMLHDTNHDQQGLERADVHGPVDVSAASRAWITAT